ncbi:hypothetical protein CEXT_31571 [Caerostris extrusa]|uniref:Uncharacterized protein n=1 Tax=Caerostris extrusa TaxID=172846 RepID=A0AAV4UEN0_CAEEX|nr:hypothetical protein CEXT_31571 [Caerostris extrusa]
MTGWTPFLFEAEEKLGQGFSDRISSSRIGPVFLPIHGRPSQLSSLAFTRPEESQLDHSEPQSPEEVRPRLVRSDHHRVK